MRVFLAFVIPLSACSTPPPPLEQARAAHAGALAPYTREVEAEVHYGFPGRWQWELAYQPPERFRMSLTTSAGRQHYVFDGSTLHSYLGKARVSEDSRDADAHASIARWLGVISLWLLESAEQRTGPAEPERRLEWREVDPSGLGATARRALSVRFPDTGARYRLGLDGRGRIVAATGPIEIAGIGAGELSARFSDFRAVDGQEVPFSAHYELNGMPFFDERVVSFVPGPVELHPGAP